MSVQTAARLGLERPGAAHLDPVQNPLAALAPTIPSSEPPLPDARLRVGYLVPPSHQFAGIERVVHEVASVLATQYRAALDVHVIYASRYPDIAQDRVPYRLHHLDVGRLRSIPGPLRRLLGAVPLDMLVVAQVEAASVAYAALRFASGPSRHALLVPHLHGDPTVEERRSPTSRVLFPLYRRFIAPHAAAVLAVSPTLAERSQGLAAGRPVHFAPNPARSFADTASARIGGEPPVFACLGRLDRQKGQDVLLRAMPAVLARHPGARLDLIGNGEDEPMLRALAVELGIAANVRFHGFVADPSDLLRQASALVLPSRWEGFPLALVEGLAFGLPLVATMTRTGAGDLVIDPRLGRLVPVEDPAALAAAMLAVLDEPRGEAEDAPRKARAAAFAPAAVARVHARLIADIVAGERGPTPAALLAAQLRREA